MNLQDRNPLWTFVCKENGKVVPESRRKLAVGKDRYYHILEYIPIDTNANIEIIATDEFKNKFVAIIP